MKKIIVLMTLLTLCFVSPIVSADVSMIQTQGKNFITEDNTIVILKGVAVIDLESIATNRGYTPVSVLEDLVINRGVKLVRLTINPDADAGEMSLGWNNNEDEYFNNYLDPVVQRAMELDAYVIIDFHYISNYNENLRDMYLKIMYIMPFWNYVAPKYANNPNVIFEIFNEPIRYNQDLDDEESGDDSWETWKNVMVQPVVDLIRGEGADNLIIIGGPLWNQNMNEAIEYPVQGDNLAYALHLYPMHFYAGMHNNYTELINTLPVIISEWGFEENGSDLLNGTIEGYAEPFYDWMTSLDLSWVAFVYDSKWAPSMLTASGDLTSMGEFVFSVITPDIPVIDNTLEELNDCIGDGSFWYNNQCNDDELNDSSVNYTADLTNELYLIVNKLFFFQIDGSISSIAAVLVYDDSISDKIIFKVSSYFITDINETWNSCQDNNCLAPIISNDLSFDIPLINYMPEGENEVQLWAKLQYCPSDNDILFELVEYGEVN